MDIGVTYSSNPSRLIQKSGEFLSNNIRDIGKQIQGTILEINTKKDLARFAQNLQQNVNPNSDDFAQQAVQVAANHPLAIQDPRGQIALNILGKAHGEWKQAQLAVNRFNTPINMPGVGLVNRNTGDVIRPAAPPKPVSVYGQGLVDPLTGDVILPEGTRPSASANAPRALSPGAILVDPTGKTLAENPKPEPTLTPYQGAQLKRAEKKAAVDAIKTEISQYEKDIASAVRQYEASFKREQNAQGDEKLRHQADKTEIGKIADDLKKKKEDRLKALRDLESSAVEEDSADMLPPVTPNAAAPAPGVRRVPVFDPQGNPLNIREDQLDAALQAGWKRR